MDRDPTIDYANPRTPKPRRDRPLTIVYDADGVRITHGPVAIPIHLKFVFAVLTTITAALIATGLGLLLTAAPRVGHMEWDIKQVIPPPTGTYPPPMPTYETTSHWHADPAATARKRTQRRAYGGGLLLCGAICAAVIAFGWRSTARHARRVSLLTLDADALRLRTSDAREVREWVRPSIAAVFVDAVQAKGVFYHLALVTRDGDKHQLIENMPSGDAHAIVAACNAVLTPASRV